MGEATAHRILRVARQTGKSGHPSSTTSSSRTCFYLFAQKLFCVHTLAAVVGDLNRFVLGRALKDGAV